MFLRSQLRKKDRGIPTEAMLEQMRASTPPVNDLVGTPKGALTAREKELLGRPWEIRVHLTAATGWFRW